MRLLLRSLLTLLISARAATWRTTTSGLGTARRRKKPAKRPCSRCGKMITDSPNARWQHEVYGVCAQRQQRAAEHWEAGAGGAGLTLISADEASARGHEGGSSCRTHRTRSPLPRTRPSRRSSSYVREDDRAPQRQARQAPMQWQGRGGQGPRGEGSAGPAGNGGTGSGSTADVISDFLHSVGQVLRLQGGPPL